MCPLCSFATSAKKSVHQLICLTSALPDNDPLLFVVFLPAGSQGLVGHPPRLLDPQKTALQRLHGQWASTCQHWRLLHSYCKLQGKQSETG
jgi:hypothetical protein